MSTPRDAGRVVIVGGGLAGYSAAVQLRALGHAGPVAIVDPEPSSYDRPPLSKTLMNDDFAVEGLAFASAEKLRSNRLDTHFGRSAVALEPAAGEVLLDDGTRLIGDTVLLATGGTARRLTLPGADEPGVHVLRTFADALAIRSRAVVGSSAVVIGAGLIGAELASSLVGAGVRVTLVDPAAVPLIPAVGELMARYLHDMHDLHDVRRVQGLPSAIQRSDDRLTVVVDGGERIPADVVVVGVGLTPSVELARAAGIATDDGILVDDRHRTSAERVYAAGDVARLRDDEGVLHRREEHWEAAQLGGQRAAYGMLGLEVPPRGATWFWSDRHGIHLEATGRLTGPGEIVVREGGSHPAVFLVQEGTLAGAAAIDDSVTVRAARRLIDQRVEVSADDLRDPGVALRSLLKSARAAPSSSFEGLRR